MMTTSSADAKTWKEAASLIVVTQAGVTNRVGHSLTKNNVFVSRVLGEKLPMSKAAADMPKVDYRLMMVKRSGLSSFMASAYVFPGGAVEISDYSGKWWDLFNKHGISRDQLHGDFSANLKGSRPQMVTEPYTIQKAIENGHEPEDFLPGDIALRITAIRETFEETGVLLLTDPRKGVTSIISDEDDLGVNLSLWRQKLRTSSEAFFELCESINLIPNLWSLHEWSNWLTPISVGHKRFDTMFYICCLETQPKVVLDQTEVTTLKWCTPIEMLDEHTQERVFLAPPQVYELSRIHHLPSYDVAKEFINGRKYEGLERWMPVLATYNDGAISYLPGDSMYPREPDIIGRKPVPDFPQQLIEMRNKAQFLNRIELRGPTCISLCTIKLPCGHMSPITFPPEDIRPSAPSMM